MAAIKGLQIVTRTETSDIEVELLSDSQYLIDGMTKQRDERKQRNWSTVKNGDLWQRLYQESRGKVITWQKVVAHTNVLGNREADRLASLACIMSPTIPSVPVVSDLDSSLLKSFERMNLSSDAKDMDSKEEKDPKVDGSGNRDMFGDMFKGEGGGINAEQPTRKKPESRHDFDVDDQGYSQTFHQGNFKDRSVSRTRRTNSKDLFQVSPFKNDELSNTEQSRQLVLQPNVVETRALALYSPGSCFLQSPSTGKSSPNANSPIPRSERTQQPSSREMTNPFLSPTPPSSPTTSPSPWSSLSPQTSTCSHNRCDLTKEKMKNWIEQIIFLMKKKEIDLNNISETTKEELVEEIITWEMNGPNANFSILADDKRTRL
eukprot:TRINITY_DN861_c0_g2_i3.p1 TRINITY_DN861_c0_g2~~TRINITY_DN861_c0_g2_i3.p1  ORF type:complete len:375 (-),score=68.21 TRINITY_DN861_c0_g2_i3:125-1249(-)